MGHFQLARALGTSPLLHPLHSRFADAAALSVAGWVPGCDSGVGELRAGGARDVSAGVVWHPEVEVDAWTGVQPCATRGGGRYRVPF